jgi:hypothetical protein
MTDYQVAKMVAAACLGIAAGVAGSVSRGADRLRDFDRGELAAARHIEQKIRELDLLKLIGTSI